MRRREVELEVEEHTIKLPSSFQEVISILVLAITVVQISAPIPQSEGLQLGLLCEQSILPRHFCITTLSAHAALIMFLNLLFENIVQKPPKIWTVCGLSSFLPCFCVSCHHLGSS